MLIATLVLTPVLVHQGLELVRDLRVVLEAPQALEQGGQLLGHLTLACSRGLGKGTQPFPSLQIGLVLVQHKVLSENVCVAEALKDGVDKAGVAVVANPNHPGHLAPALEVGPPLLGSTLELTIVILGPVSRVGRDLVDHFAEKAFH